MLLFVVQQHTLKPFKNRLHISCFSPPHPPIYELRTVNEQNMCPFLFVQYLPLMMFTCILHFLSHHLGVFVHSALLQSVATQYAVPSVFLIEAAIVFHCLLSIVTINRVVIRSCFFGAFCTAVNQSCSSVQYSCTGTTPCLIMCFLSGNAVALS